MDENRKEFYDKTGIDIDDRIKNVSGIPNFNSLVEYIKELENKIKNLGERSEPPHPLLGDECDNREILRNAYLKDGVYFAIVNDYSMGFRTTRIITKDNKIIIYKSVSDCKAGHVIVWGKWMEL